MSFQHFAGFFFIIFFTFFMPAIFSGGWGEVVRVSPLSIGMSTHPVSMSLSYIRDVCTDKKWFPFVIF